MVLPTINLSKEALSDFDGAMRKEWVLTNGLGGYASSTALSINTRKYHGLLVAAFHPPGDRRVCLEKLDEEISVKNSVYPLGANEFQNGVFPQGYRFLEEFSVSPFPRYHYSIDNVNVWKTVFMLHEKNAVVAVYKVANENEFDVKIRVFPLVNWRHFHSVTDRWKKPVELSQTQYNKEVYLSSTVPSSMLAIKSTDAYFRTEAKWIERLYYREEAQRGESFLDDCYQPGYFEKTVKANGTETFALVALASADDKSVRMITERTPVTMYDVEASYEEERKQHEDLLTKFYDTHKAIAEADWLSWLLLATDAFPVKGLDDAQTSVIAGYPWFGIWGRDTFVSLSGLTLLTGRFEEARQVFLTFKERYSNGLIPNFISDSDEPLAYNTVDATLWFVNAVLQYLKYTEDFKFVQEQLWEPLKTSMECHIRGTVFNIHVDDDGLLSHGPQLTWMDAAVNSQPVTPRAGKAVEVQALWYNALKTMELLAARFEEKSAEEMFARLAERAKSSFVEKFWNEKKSCLFDVVDGGERDSSLRPNQVFAVALDFALLDQVRGESVVDVLVSELLTPFGLRTLERSDPRYVGVYGGDRARRDNAYHNGTVWSWLLGPFVTAFLKMKGHDDSKREIAWSFLMPLLTKHVYEVGLGTISEVFGGELPHKAGGCIAQAWSVAESLRAYVEDVMRIRPKYEKEVLQSLG
jgi:predicted glycogen debranching enzyme